MSGTERSLVQQTNRGMALMSGNGGVDDVGGMAIGNSPHNDGSGHVAGYLEESDANINTATANTLVVRQDNNGGMNNEIVFWERIRHCIEHPTTMA